MFFKEKVDTSEVIKWGVFAGLLQGAYLGIATVLIAQKEILQAVTEGIPHLTTLFLLLLIVISALITSVIVFAHPIYSAMQKHYGEAVLTLITTILTLIAVLGFMLFIFQQLFT